MSNEEDNDASNFTMAKSYFAHLESKKNPQNRKDLKVKLLSISRFLTRRT